SYTYTNSSIKYGKNNGVSVLDPINNQIRSYNSYTSYCAGKVVANVQTDTTNCATSLANGSTAVSSAACFAPDGTPDPACVAGDIANPYWNAPVQKTFDLNASYIPFDIFPGAFNLGSTSFEVPNTATLVLNYKHDRLSITPSFQYRSGSYYGAPLVSPGVDPASGCAPLPGTAPDAGRYVGGTAGFGAGGAYDATTCNNALLGIPTASTGVFDNLGAFRDPSRFTAHLAFAYEASKQVSMNLTFANLIDRCFGGSSAPWVDATIASGIPRSKICGYGSGALNPVGNFYNPGMAVQPLVAYPYVPQFGSLPISAYFEVKLKI
ncbi:MAG: hypothetical protein ABR584_07285, partial [Candidatus Baltobacteraceae bacterium]